MIDLLLVQSKLFFFFCEKIFWVAVASENDIYVYIYGNIHKHNILFIKLNIILYWGGTYYRPLLVQYGGGKSSQPQVQPKQQQQTGKEGSEDDMPIEEEKTFFQKYW